MFIMHVPTEDTTMKQSIKENILEYCMISGDKGTAWRSEQHALEFYAT